MEPWEQELRRLRRIVFLLGAFVFLLGAAGIYQFLSRNQFNEINAGRINILDSNGTLRLVISNHQLQDPGAYGGKKIPRRDRPAGMIFFNDDGDECGGLVFDGNSQSASMTYSIDQYKGDQIMQLQYAQEGDTGAGPGRSYGLKMWQRSDRYPTTRLMAKVDSLKNLGDTAAYARGIDGLRKAGWLGKERLFIGREPGGGFGLFIRDSAGNPRIKIAVGADNKPVIATISADSGRTFK